MVLNGGYSAVFQFGPVLANLPRHMAVSRSGRDRFRRLDVNLRHYRLFALIDNCLRKVFQ